MPPNHRLFLGQSISELNLEMFEDWILRRDELYDTMEYGIDGHDHAAIHREIDQLNDALGDESEVQDDLIEKWERQLESGEMPDLDEGLDRG